MTIRSSIIPLVVAGILAVSCQSTKQVTYFQDLPQHDTSWQGPQGEMVKMQSGDAITIVVNTQDPLLDAQFNIVSATRTIGQESGATSGTNNGSLSRYTVDPDGNIQFPVIGKIYILGLTRHEVQTKIREELISQDLVKDPVVTVEFANLYISVLGDVSKPGRYAIDREQITILDAIGKAGDLNITGSRYDVLVLRTEEGNVQKAYRLDLLNANKLYKSPVFYLQQNDIVYVNPNKFKRRQASVNGNNVLSASFWLSLVSVLLSGVTTWVAITK